MIITKLPRPPFLPHSQRLVQHLLGRLDAPCSRVLEIGCGPRSPLLPILRQAWPGVALHQIDVQPKVVEQAREYNPTGHVELLSATNLSTIGPDTKQAIVAMSVFDQNPDDVTRRIASELHRVLEPGGVAIYVHNEELNAPATSASMFYESFQPLRIRADPRYMLPSNLWEPTNDLEYCTGACEAIDRGVARLGDQGLPLRQYIDGLHPRPEQLRRMQAGHGRMDAEVLHGLNYDKMSALRRAVELLRTSLEVPLQDRSTADLLGDRISRLFSRVHGFQIEIAGVFEIRLGAGWRTHFRQRPVDDYFVRGLTRFGYSSDVEPRPVTPYRQELNKSPQREGDEIMFIAYQYGCLARKLV